MKPNVAMHGGGTFDMVAFLDSRTKISKKFIDKSVSRHTRYARKLRDWLIEQLGGVCVQCGSTDDLQFDHIDPQTRTWSCHGTGFKLSMLRYRRDYLNGLLQLLCGACNKQKGNKRPVILPVCKAPTVQSAQTIGAVHVEITQLPPSVLSNTLE